MEARTTTLVNPTRASVALSPGTVDGTEIDEEGSDGGLEALEKHLNLLQRDVLQERDRDITALVHQLGGSITFCGKTSL